MNEDSFGPSDGICDFEKISYTIHMLLKRLELQGFKSFADKTDLDLSANIVAVVGPNGSGKSNVTDAIRWLLGERDARNLRGGKVEDLIFAGNDKKARLGLAQATLYFDNSSGFFPVDFTEVSISRRVTRDGESQFFLNKAEVRLKDVIDFFAKSKLGARGLTIITQGDSDSFIKSSPAERREMIEEILGLKEYQIKKAEALRKLKNTGINLAQASSSLEELKPHLRFLKKQVARYQDRDIIAKELATLENSFYGLRLKSLSEELTTHKSNLQEINLKIAAQEKNCAGLEVGFKKVKDGEPDAAQEYKKIEALKNNLLNSRALLQKEFGKIEARLEFQAKSVIAPSADLSKLIVDIKNIAKSAISEESVDVLRSKIDLIISRIDEALGEKKPSEAYAMEGKEELKKLNEEALAKLKNIDEEIKKISTQEEEIRSKLGNFNKDFSAAYELLEAEKRKLAILNDTRNKEQFAIERVELKQRDLKEELMAIGRTAGSFEHLDVGRPNIADEGESWTDEGAMRRMFKLRGELASIGEVDETLLKEARETEERFNFLTKEMNDLEVASRDLQILIKELDAKLHKEFSEAIEKINDEFEKLMKLMFGGGKARLVVKTIEDKKEAAEPGEDGEVKELAEETEEENDMAKGVEIEIALPRKRVSGLEVLSGGERTLVSIAVIFSLISVSPPPFLVLDEIDAALDEGNARRCSQILKEFSKHTQFILITHNRATMEAANVLYGVTMGENGTSKILSLKLSDPEAHAAAK